MKRINVNGKMFLLIALIFSLLLFSSYQSNIAGAFSRYSTQKELNPTVPVDLIYELKEITALQDSKAGIKQEIVGIGGDDCYIVEPVYAAITCHKEAFLSSGESAYVINSGSLIRDDVKRGIKIFENLTDYKPTDVQDINFVGGSTWKTGQAHKIRWAILLESLPNVQSVKMSEDSAHDVIVVAEFQNGIKQLAMRYTNKGWENRVELANDRIENIYIFETKLFTGDFWCFISGGCLVPTDPGDNWNLRLNADAEYLTFEVAGQQPAFTIPSDGCNLLSSTELEDKIASKISTVPATDAPGLPLGAQIPNKVDIDKISQEYYENVVLQGGDLLVSKGISESQAYYYQQNTIGKEVVDYYNVQSNILGSGNLDCPGCAILYPYLYRNTGIQLGNNIYPGRYKGETVICDQSRERLISFTRIPQSPGMVENDVCYAMPTKPIDMSKVERFACAQSVCTAQFADDGYPLWDATNFQCVKAGTEIKGQLCQEGGVGYCDTLAYLPIATGGACLQVGEVCVEDTGAKAEGFFGYCKTTEKALPVCCPGERTPSGLVCNSEGTAYIQSEIDKSKCPEGYCCLGNPLYQDTVNVKENDGCSEGTVCCLDIETGATVSGCSATQCGEGDVNTKTLIDEVIDELIKRLGLDDTKGVANTLLTWALIFVGVILGIIILVLIFNLLISLAPVLLKSIFTGRIFSGGGRQQITNETSRAVSNSFQNANPLNPQGGHSGQQVFNINIGGKQ